MSGFEWLIVLLLLLIAAGLFSIARAVRNVGQVFVEVMAGMVANVRAKPIAVTTERETVEKE
jgi:hypothetical protein